MKVIRLLDKLFNKIPENRKPAIERALSKILFSYYYIKNNIPWFRAISVIALNEKYKKSDEYLYYKNIFGEVYALNVYFEKPLFKNYKKQLNIKDLLRCIITPYTVIDKYMVR